MSIINKHFSKIFEVLPSHSAKNVGSGDLEVLSTPMLIAYIEETCKDFLNIELDDNSVGSVGVNINISHIKPTKINSKVKIEIIIKNIEKEKIIEFLCEAYEQQNKELIKIGYGTHTRVIINNEKFLKKL